MIKVVARTLVRPECIAAYQALARELAAKTQAEPGNLSYTLNQSLETPCLHAMIEVWESREALNRHMQTEHFRRLVPELSALSEEKYPLEFFSQIAP